MAYRRKGLFWSWFQSMVTLLPFVLWWGRVLCQEHGEGSLSPPVNKKSRWRRSYSLSMSLRVAPSIATLPFTKPPLPKSHFLSIVLLARDWVSSIWALRVFSKSTSCQETVMCEMTQVGGILYGTEDTDVQRTRVSFMRERVLVELGSI